MVSPVHPPDSLRAPDLAPVWLAARARLDRFGSERRGRIDLGDLPRSARLALSSLLDQRPAKSLDLDLLETGLRRLRVGSDLDAALEALGFPPSESAREQRELRQATRAAREVARIAVGDWPEPWAGEWVDGIIAAGSLAGLTVEQARGLVADVRRALDSIGNHLSPPHLSPRHLSPPLITNESGLASRTDLAARLFGSAHALDTGTLLERAAGRALEHLLAESDRELRDRPDRSALWAGAGFHLDLVSSPVLAWGLTLDAGSPIAALSRSATEAGLPLPIPEVALDRYPVTARREANVLVAENPRVVEAAAELRVPHAVITTNGNPRRASIMLVSQLIQSGATVLYHGDFDSPGIAICRRMAELGCKPLKMGRSHYVAACDRAARFEVDLPVDDDPCGPTPWDPLLESEFARRRQIVHEELVLDDLLGGGDLLG